MLNRYQRAPLLLADVRPIASGSIRDVYLHPFDPTLLVKVVRASTIDEKFGSGRRWYKSRRRRYKHLISFLREIREQIALDAGSPLPPPFLQRIVGFETTDVGVGLVVQAERARDGSLAPTLTKLIESGRFDATVATALNRFIAQLEASEVIVGDLHRHNVVYAYKPEIGDHFVMIDGIGFKTLIPLERVSRYLNRRNTRQRARTLLSHVDLLLRQSGHPIPGPA